MPRFVALLRAINVGGRTVKMDQLRKMFEALRFSRVETFIASGNVVFESRAKDPRMLEGKIERHLRRSLGYEVAAFIRSTEELEKIAKYQPFAASELNAESHSLYIVFLPTPPGGEAQRKLMTFRTNTDDLHTRGREIYWLCRKKLSESALSGALLEKTVGMSATIRNATTVKGLVAKYPASRFQSLRKEKGGNMRRTTRVILIVSSLVGLGGPAPADVITDWNDKAVAASYRAGLLPPAQTRNVAVVHLAMFDAVNAVTPRYAPYRVRPSAEPGTSPDAAAAAAAHFVLVRMYPDQAKELDAAFQASLSAVPDGPQKAHGVQLGERVAAAILDERKTDGADAPNTYRPFTTAGTYVPTVFPVGPRWGSVKPFALKAGSQFRPAAPYALTSAQWANDYNEVKRMGAKTGSKRSTEQDEIARFWEFTGPGTYNPVVHQLSKEKQLDVLENARLFALASMAGADALIAILDAKYTYNFWRPVTAIRNGDLDGNDATERDPAWEPFIATPMHPEYPCAHCITQAAVASVLEGVLGDAVTTFTLTSPTAPGVTRSFARLSDYVAEVINARVYDGVHYRASGEIGAAMGRRVGAYIVQNSLKPVR